ncbi:hypothetical protein MTO96_031824 [Rhipicephalus appendiculatus]
MPTTERKFQMMPEPEDATATTEGKKYFLVQGDALSDLLSKTPCPCCLATGVKFQGGTQLGLAMKLQLVMARGLSVEKTNKSDKNICMSLSQKTCELCCKRPANQVNH